MGSYIQDNLTSNEQVIAQARVSIWSLLPTILLGLLLLYFYGAGLLLWLVAYLRYTSTELAFTDKRVIAKFGFIRRATIEMKLDKIESVQVIQGWLGRIFNFGSLIISGAGNPRAPIPGISNPMAFRRQFMEYQDRHPETSAV